MLDLITMVHIKQTLERAIELISSNKLKKESHVKQYVVMPILRSLGWNDSDPSEVEADFSFNSGGKVDFALLNQEKKPIVFIKAKSPGNINDEGVNQVFGDAANTITIKGVPFLILCDGNIWDFYLSMAAGDPVERRFYRMELKQEYKIDANVRFFEKYLHKNKVGLKQTRIDAERLHDENKQKYKAKSIIPTIWQELLNNSDEAICRLLGDAVARKCGNRPELSDVKNILKETGSAVSSLWSYPETPPSEKRITNKKLVGFIIDGQLRDTKTAIRTLAEVIKEFQRRDSEFIHRLDEETRSPKRRLVARRKDDLYEKEHLRSMAYKLEDGWWVGVNMSAERVRKNIRLSCKIMGVKFGSQLKLIER